MHKPKVNQPLYIFLVLAFCLNLFPVQAQAQTGAPVGQNQAQTAASAASTSAIAAQGVLPTGINFAPGYHKLFIDNTDQAALSQASTGGGVLLADYSSFSLWKVPDNTPSLDRLQKNSSVESPAGLDQIGLRSGQVDTSKKPDFTEAKISGPQFWLVQFVGPIKQEWLAKLQKSGAEIVMYMPSDGYVIWASGSQLDAVNKQVATGNTELQWSGNYKPEYRLDPALANRKNPDSAAPVQVTVQFYNTPAIQSSLNQLTALGGKVIKPPSQVLNFTDITLEVPSNQLETLARWPDVFNVEKWAAPTRNDEVQGQIVAGNVISASGKVGPTAPGYLNWLNTKGFPTTASSYPIVDVVDDGVDNGTTSPLHPDFYVNGSKSNASRLVNTANCGTDTAADGLAGHGNINAGIVGAYNNTSGQPYVDSNGFNRGVGISPFGRLAETKIFNNNGSYNIDNCANTDAGVVLKSYQKGALITSNSWGDSSAAGGYDASAQAYDTLTRDATSAVAGNQQILHVFSAGNDGAGSTTIGSPGTAKNVLTVGATENVRDANVADGCGELNADNADDMATFSSRGPTTDGRVKPEIVAPGTHVQGPASQDPGFDGTGVCGGANNGNSSYPNAKYYPNFAQNSITQTLYTWSSGTSHSAPAVAGGMSLLFNYYGRVLAPSQSPTQTLNATPSPAMAKALTLNAPRYLQGSDTNDTLPSNSQGWGDLNLGGIFDNVPRYLVDQSYVFSASGQTFTRVATVQDNTKPLRVTLAWTDAAGSTTGNSYVNNLDLQVTVNGKVYKGNVFSKNLSVTGGSADAKNNVENVFLPAGITGTVAVRVIATNIAGDGVPGVAPATDQDFALVIYNGSVTNTATPVLGQTNVALTDAGGNPITIPQPGVNQRLIIGLINNGTAPATGITGSLTSSTPGVYVITSTSGYSNIAVGATGTNTTPYTFIVSPGVACGSIISFIHTFYYNGTFSGSSTINYQLGTSTIAATSTVFTSTEVPKPISDGPPSTITSILPVNFSGKIGKIKATINVSHTWDSDLSITLISPSGTHIVLVSGRGGNGDNFTNTVFDDSAATPISSGSPSFTGSFRPEQPLSGLNGETATGNWTLQVSDGQTEDGGSLNSWKIEIFALVYNCTFTPPCPVNIVTSNTDNALAIDCGTLSYAFGAIKYTANTTITFNLGASKTISVTGDGFKIASLPPGIALNGGGDCTNPVILDGSGSNPGSVGLVLNGSSVSQITVTHFKSQQIVAHGGLIANILNCVRAIT